MKKFLTASLMMPLFICLGCGGSEPLDKAPEKVEERRQAHIKMMERESEETGIPD